MSEVLDNIVEVDISRTAKSKYLDYAVSVLTDRALPDIRDGLKPVHRRILYSMNDLSLAHTKAHKKSARVVGDVIGKYHPHGDTAVYDAMVRMAQDFSMRSVLVDGQGNFGSIDGDSQAAMRYTEVRMSMFGEMMFSDIELNTVSFIPNYDETESEPSVLPTPFPNLLINGIQGIAVGMASNIPPHNPVEVMNAVKAMVDARSRGSVITSDEIYSIIKAPDFPTAGLVYNLSGTREAIDTGRGKVMLRGRWHKEDIGLGRESVVVTEIPYQVNKTRLIESIAKLAKPNKAKGGVIDVDGISKIRDESDKDGMRLVVELKRDYDAESVFAQLAKLTDLEKSINYNATVLVNGVPRLVGLREILEHFIDHRLDVIIRRTRTRDAKARDRLHILSALLKALHPDYLDRVIQAIRKASSPDDANLALQDLLGIDDFQAKSILAMRLQRLTSMQVDELQSESDRLMADRAGYAEILANELKRFEIIQQESDKMLGIFEETKYKGECIWGRRETELAPHLSALDLESMTKREECTIYLTAKGYVKRMPVSDLQNQNRGTLGKKKIKLSNGDYILQSLGCHSHDYLLAITESGKIIGIRAYEVPDSEKGRYVANLLGTCGEAVVRFISVTDLNDPRASLVLMTRSGKIKRTRLTEYAFCIRRGVNGIKLQGDDVVVFAGLTSGNCDVMSFASDGFVNRYSIDVERNKSRTAAGNRSIRLNEGQHVIGAALIDLSQDKGDGYLVCLTETGMVKISQLDNYPARLHRGSKGIYAMKVTEKTGGMFRGMVVCSLEKDLVVTTKSGMTNRVDLASISVTSRSTSGVRFMNLKDGDSLADAFSVEREVDVSECDLEASE